jgi:hypothetical protein
VKHCLLLCGDGIGAAAAVWIPALFLQFAGAALSVNITLMTQY